MEDGIEWKAWGSQVLAGFLKRGGNSGPADTHRMENPDLPQLTHPAPCGPRLPPHFWPRVTPPLPKSTSHAVSLLLSPPPWGPVFPSPPVASVLTLLRPGTQPRVSLWEAFLDPPTASATSTLPASWLHLWDAVHRPAAPTAGHGARPGGPRKPVKSERAARKHVYYHMWNRLPVQVQCMRQGAQGLCTGTTLRDGMGREVGGDLGMRDTCTPVADSCQCMAKPLQYCNQPPIKIN